MQMTHPESGHVITVDAGSVATYAGQGWVEVEKPTPATPKSK